MDWKNLSEFIPFVQGSVHQRRASDRKVQWNEIIKAALIVGMVLYGDHIQLGNLGARVGRVSQRLTSLHAEVDQILIATHRRNH